MGLLIPQNNVLFAQIASHENLKDLYIEGINGKFRIPAKLIINNNWAQGSIFQEAYENEQTMEINCEYNVLKLDLLANDLEKIILFLKVGPALEFENISNARNLKNGIKGHGFTKLENYIEEYIAENEMINEYPQLPLKKIRKSKPNQYATLVFLLGIRTNNFSLISLTMNSNQKRTYLEDSIVKDFAEKLDLYSPEMEKNKENLLEENPMLEDKLKDLFKSVSPPSPKLIVITPAPIKVPVTKAKIDWIGNEPKFNLSGQSWRFIPNHKGLQGDLIKYCEDRGAHLPTKIELNALPLSRVFQAKPGTSMASLAMFPVAT